MNIKHLVYLFIRLKDICLLLLSSYYEYYEHSAQDFMWTHVFNSLGYKCGTGTDGSYGNPFLTISWVVKLFSREVACLYFSTSHIWGLSLSMPLSVFVMVHLLSYTFFYYLWWNIVFLGPAVLLHILLHLPRMHSPNHSLTGPFLKSCAYSKQSWRMW